MNWPNLDELSKQVSLPEGYRYAQLRRIDVPALISAIAAWYPDVSVGAASCFLELDFYEKDASFAGESERNLWIVLTWKGTEFVGFASWDREPAAQALYARFGVIAPSHRGARLAFFAMQLGEAAGRAMRYGFIYTLATLKTPQMQQALERAGYQLLGFAPGYDRELVSPGVVKRVYEAFYAKILVPEEELLRPSLSNMTPKTRELFEILFSQPPQTAT